MKLRRNKFFISIRQRILLVALAPAVLVALLVTGVLVVGQWNSAAESQHRRIGALVRQMASVAEFNLFAGNTAALERQLELALKEPDVVAAAILSPDGKVLVSTTSLEALPEPDHHELVGLNAPGRVPGLLEEVQQWYVQPIHSTQTGESDLFNLSVEQTPLLGRLLVAVSVQSLRDQITLYAWQAGGVSLVMLFLGILLALGLARGLIFTLDEIAAVVEAITHRRGYRHVRVFYRDELGQLAEGVNTMADAVASAQENLLRRIAGATANLRAERDAAAQAAESRSRFFAAASHDLRQPVQALGLYMARLMQDARRSTLLPRIRQLAQSVHVLQDMLDTLLDYSRLSGGIYRTEPRPVRAADLILPLVEDFQPSAEAAGLVLRHRITDCWVQTDPALMRRILINLLSNALRYTAQGGILIAVRRRGEHAGIEVWDTGRGIPEDMQAAVFDELVQIGNPERDPSKGLGLGLAIVRRTADLLGHALWLRSREGRGSCFHLTLPLANMPNLSDQPPDADGTTDYLLAWNLDETMLGWLDSWGEDVSAVTTFEAVTELIAGHGRPTKLVCATQGDLAGCLDCLDRLDAATTAGSPLRALIIHPGPAPAVDLRQAGRFVLSQPFRPARLRALLNHLDDQAGCLNGVAASE